MQALFDSTLFPADVSPEVGKLIILFVKGVLVLSATWIIAYSLRTSAAAIRFTVWCTGLLSLMTLPLLSSVLPAWQVEMLPVQLTVSERVQPSFEAMARTSAAPRDGVEARAPLTAPDQGPAAVPAAGSTSSASIFSFFSGLNYHWTTWAFIVWVLGVFVASVRLMLAHAGALLLVQKSDVVHDEDWHLLAERVSHRLGINRYVRLRTSSWTSVPMCVGIFRPVVVLPEGADAWDESQRRTVLFHELAHVKRKDCLMQLLTQITCALHWFNPLVWVAVWQLRIERERACDDLVLTSGIDPSSYAETLLQTARQLKNAEWSTLATVSMARQSQLEGRLLSILDSTRRRSLNKASRVLTFSILACIVVPLAIMQPAKAQEAPAEVVAVPPPPPAVVAVPHVPAHRVVVPQITIPDINIPDIVVAPFDMPDFEIPEIEIPDFELPDIELPDIEIPAFEWNLETAHLGEDTPVDSLTIDQIIQLSKYGMDADFIRSIKALGFKNLTYRELIQVGKYGARASYIRDMQTAGYTSLTLSDYANMSKYGVNPEFVAAMKNAGYNNLFADELVRMSKYGVDQRMVETLAAYGYENVSVDELVSASKYGVSDELIETLDEAGYDSFSINDLVSASKYGVDGRLITSLRTYGYTELSPGELIAASKYGLDVRLMESLDANGYKNIPFQKVISMSKYGVDARYVTEMSEIGLDMDVDELIQMRKYGVDAAYIKQMIEAGLEEEITVDQLINMRKHGVDAEFIRSMRDNN